MSTSTWVRVESERTVGLSAKLADYIELTKPRILTLVLVTIALSGVIATWGQPDVGRLFHTLVGTTFVAGSASILNQWLERSLDARMQRTKDRPLPSGRLGRFESLIVGSVSVLFGLAYLVNLTSLLTASCAALTWLLYVGVYTPLKTRTWLNTLVGAVPGALPVLIGWTGAGASLDTRSLCLFLLVYLWQFPHFMAIAWLYRRQYERAQMLMLTVVDPTGRRAGIQAVVAATSVVIVSLVPVALAMSPSPVYVLATLLLGVAHLIYAIRFLLARTDLSARGLLRTSLVYLPSQLILITLLTLGLI